MTIFQNTVLRRLGRCGATIALSITLVVALGACSKKNGGPTAQSYGNDGYMGLSNSNPHLPNKNGSYLNYGEDSDFAKEKLEEIGGIASMNIVFQGINLYVTLKPKQGVDEAYLRQKAISVLRYNMPRYIVHVDTKR